MSKVTEEEAVPHLDVYALESDLTGHEDALIGGLTSAVAGVYGEWVRPSVVVRLFGLPAGRWGIGGRPAEAPAPSVTFGIRADALERPDAPAILSALAGGVTDVIAGVFGERLGGATVEFVAQRDDRIAGGPR
jgi:phenylpyruvate tautomerase PptA (4-oxalocrotonate tautomerase family)